MTAAARFAMRGAPMTQTPADQPTVAERILWVVLASLAWKYSVAEDARGIASQSALGTTIVVAGSALGLACLVVALTDRAARWLRGSIVFSLVALIVIGFGLADAMWREHLAYTFTTDAAAFMDYAARLLVHGKNPYDVSLYGAMVAQRVPIELQTPLVDGGFSDRLAYPSLSFAVLVPFVSLGIPTTLVYGLAMCGCLYVVYRVAPPELRALAFLPFFSDDVYLTYSFGGLTDSVWALALAIAAVYWRRPLLSALFVGLACSYKQHPWLIVPFLLVRVAREAPSGARIRHTIRYGAVVGGTFALTQLPFILWSPRSWLLGAVEPLVARMVPLGTGLSAFVSQNGVALPRITFTLAFWFVYGALLLLCATWSAGRALVWVAPSIAFFFNWRSFSSYWVYNAIPFVVELLVTGLPKSGFDVGRHLEKHRSLLRRASLAGALVLIGIVLATARTGYAHHDELKISLTGPIRTWTSFAHRIDVRVENHSDRNITPRFWVQGIHFQPLPWRIDSGPPNMAPGETATFSLSAVHRASEFDVSSGANLTVTDVGSVLRSEVRIEPDRAALSPRAVANAHYDFWDMRSGTPTFFSPIIAESPGARVAPAFSPDHHGIELFLDPDGWHAERETSMLCPALPTCFGARESIPILPAQRRNDADRRIAIRSEITLRPEPLSVWGFTPKNANLPDGKIRYGAQIWVGAESVVVLFGGEPGKGKMTDGTPFVVSPGPREQWVRHTLDIQALTKGYAPSAYPRSHVFFARFPLLDIPATQIRVALSLWSIDDTVTSARFGEIEDPVEGRDKIPDLVAQLDQTPGALDAWRAAYEADLGNLDRAYTYIDRAAKLESHPSIELQRGHLALRLGKAQDAKESFQRALEKAPIEAELGLGWACLALKEFDQSRSHFQEAANRFQAMESTVGLTPESELLQFIGTIGLATSQAANKDCAGAYRTLERLPSRERAYREDTIPELAACRPPR